MPREQTENQQVIANTCRRAYLCLACWVLNTHTHTRTHQLYRQDLQPHGTFPSQKKRLLLQPSAITSKGFSLNKHPRERKKGKREGKKKGQNRRKQQKRREGERNQETERANCKARQEGRKERKKTEREEQG